MIAPSNPSLKAAPDCARLSDNELIRSGPPVFSYAEVDPRDAPPRDYLVDLLLPRRGAHPIIGLPKKGKSRFLAHLVTCLLTEEPLFGHYSVLAESLPRILWIQTEETKYTPRERIEANLRGLGWSEERIVTAESKLTDRLVVVARERMKAFSIEEFDEWLMEVAMRGLFDVIALDSLRASHRYNENDSTDMQPVTSLMRVLGELVCFLPVHHEGHRNPEHRRFGGDAARGSNDLDAARDTAIQLVDGKFGGPLVLGFDHRDDTTRLVTVQTAAQREPSVARWEFVQQAEDDFGGTQESLGDARLFAEIQTAATPEELPKRSECKRFYGNSYSARINPLIENGTLEERTLKTGKGGRNANYLTTPGQFTEEEWTEAQSRVRERR